MSVAAVRQRQARAPGAQASPARRRAAAQRAGQLLHVAGKTIKVSNLQKVLYREAGFTKGDVIRYYLGVADVMLKHLRGRTVTLKRYPNGAGGMFFYEKNCPVHRPGWVETANIPSRNRENGLDYCLLQNKASLAWVAQLAALELHTSLSKSVAQDRPT